MNDEIKEMLELHIKNEVDLLPKNQQEVLEYITNLQEENERLKDQNINEILKKDLEICTKQYKKSEEKLEKYKSRIEKAVEYIKENAKYQKTTINNNKYYSEYLINQLLDILNGKE